MTHRAMANGGGGTGATRWAAAVLATLALLPRGLAAAEAPTGRAPPAHGSSSPVARHEAAQSIPFEKLTPQGRANVKAVLGNVTIFRRLPTRTVDCDPELYLFLIRHPDVVVNIWEALKLSQLQLKQVGPDKFRAVEQDGTTISFEYLYKSHDMHVVYAEGTYTGTLLQRPVKGACLAVVRSGYVRETDGRYYVTTRMDSFLSVEPGAVEIVAKTLQPIAAKIADSNFTQTIAFLGSLSRTAEVNPAGVQRLASRLNNVAPEMREQFAIVAGKTAERAAASAPPAAPLAAQRAPGPARR
jgi:hypothetical protein